MIIISGDSWGVGEWGRIKTPIAPGQHTVGLSGPGIGQYFSLHGKVIILSEGGSDNLRQASLFRKFLEKFTSDPGDTFYWIVTDPLRDIDPVQVVDSIDNVEQFARLQLDSFLKDINNLAGQQNIQINLIGGLCDLNTVTVEPYKNIRVVVPSWGQLLSDTYSTSIFCDACMVEWGQAIHDRRLDLLAEWTAITAEALLKRKSQSELETKNLFQYNHPTSSAHIILRNFLAPEWAEYI